MLSRPRRQLIAVAIAGAVVAADQLSKAWALRHLAGGPRHVAWTFQLSLQYNTGIAFSQATGANTLVTVVAAVVIVGLGVVAWRSHGTFTALVLGMVMGGALSNLADRVVRDHGGAVIDFIDPRWFPVFNVADAAISVGVALLLIKSVLSGEREKDEPTSVAPQS
jgi:signal peptidase II